MKIKKIIVLAVFILLIANLAAVYTLYLKIEKSDDPKEFSFDNRRYKDKRGQVNIRALNFTNEQRDKFRALKQDHKNEIDSIEKKLTSLKFEVGKAFYQDEINTNILDSLAYEVGFCQGEMKKSLFKHFVKVIDICDSTQKKIVINNIEEMAKPYRPGPGRKRMRPQFKHN